MVGTLIQTWRDRVLRDQGKQRKELIHVQRPMVGEERLSELHKAHTLLLTALNPPETDKSQITKSFYKTLRKRRKQTTPLSEEEEARWFSFDSFCELLGLAGLNQEDSGGLYAVHAHMNHDCEPNIRVSLHALKSSLTCTRSWCRRIHSGHGILS